MPCPADPVTEAIGPFAGWLVAAIASGIVALGLGAVIALVLQRLAPTAVH